MNGYPALTIRLATEADFEPCLAIDHSYETSRVWQMHYQASGNDTTVRFQTVRLPRPLPVVYPYTAGQLQQRWCRAHCFLVAERAGLVGGYVTLGLDEVEPVVWLQDAAVRPEWRRQGIATQLLSAAAEWARAYQRQRLMIALPTKNYPAIHFCQQNGFSFCGYNEFLYHSGSIALFFCATL